MRRRILRQLDTTKGYAIMEIKELAREPTTDLQPELHLSSDLQTSPRSVNSKSDWTMRGQQDPLCSAGVVGDLTTSKIAHNERELNSYPKFMKPQLLAKWDEAYPESMWLWRIDRRNISQPWSSSKVKFQSLPYLF